MKTLTSWMRNNRVVVACATVGILSAAVAELIIVDSIYHALGEPFDAVLIGFHVLLVVAIPVMLWQLWTLFRKLTAIIVAATLLFNPQLAQAAPLIIAGAAVLIIGGVVGCRIVKKCSKISRGRTNAWPEEFVATGETGALFSWTEEGYCFEERMLPVPPTVFTLNITVESVTNATVTMSAATGFNFVQSWGEFTEEMESHGLAITAGPNLSCYERDRQPASADDVPIAFDFTTRTVTLGKGGVFVTVHRSADLQHWEPLMTFNVEPGMEPLRIEDASAGAQFYRVKVSAP